MAIQGGFGLKVRIDVAETPTVIAYLVDAEMPEFEKFLADVTSHGSASGYSEFLATGQRQLNSFKITVAWDPTDSTHAALLAGFNSDDVVDIEVEDADSGETIAFDAHIVKLGRVSKMKDALKCDVTLQPTGPAVIT